MSPIPMLYKVSITFLLLFTPTAQAAEADPLFRDSDVLDITLTGPFTTINRQRDKDTEYEGGTLTYMEDGREIALNVKYEVRGNFRLRKDICSYAQLWVNFRKSEVEGTLFANQNRLKLVVQCRNPSRYENYVVKEHQAYAMTNTITDISFRSRLVNVTYQDTDRNRSRTHKGIFLEHRRNLAERIGMERVNLNAIEYTQLDPVQGTLAALLMYLVANTDYSFISAPEDECCHNAKLFQLDGEERYFPAAYDFDSSGYVNTSYAEPNEQLRLRNVRQRLYRGFCVPAEVMDTAVARFREKQEEVLAIAEDTTFVDERTARNSLEYIQDFFNIINDPDELQDEIIEECRG